MYKASLGGELQVLGLCYTRHQSNVIWDKHSSGSGQEGDVCHAAAVYTCALLGIRDPAMLCKLFDTLVLPISSYACEVWAVNPNVGEAAEVLHRSFLKHDRC